MVFGEWGKLCCHYLHFSASVTVSMKTEFLYFILQGTVYFILTVGALLNWIAFIVTKRHCFLYLAVAFTISIGTYLGFFRTQIKKKFNIRVSIFFSVFVFDSSLNASFWYYSHYIKKKNWVLLFLSSLQSCNLLCNDFFKHLLWFSPSEGVLVND